MNTEAFENAITNGYRLVPYHNWQHAQDVTRNVGILLEMNDTDYTSEIIAAKTHDIGHGIDAKPDDELEASKLTKTILEKFGFPEEFVTRTNFILMGTVFKERGKLEDHKQMLIADADIASVGKDYQIFLDNSARLYIEILPRSEYPSKEGIISYFRSQTSGFFTFLTSITNDQERIYLTEEANRNFPNFARNRNTLLDDLENNQTVLIDTVKKEWKKFYGRELLFLEEVNS